jgi:biofilm protein TabA
MIYDHIRNLHRYPQIPYLKEIQEFLSELAGFPLKPEFEILGRDLFVRTGDYETGPAAQKQFEAHAVYADLQYMILGSEVMDVSLEKEPKPVTPYKEDADIQFFQDPKEFSSLLVPQDHFTIFFPGELHKPGCLVNGVSEKVKKLVFKIRMPKNFSPEAEAWTGKFQKTL